jgi:hypothetical protein
LRQALRAAKGQKFQSQNQPTPNNEPAMQSEHVDYEARRAAEAAMAFALNVKDTTNLRLDALKEGQDSILGIVTSLSDKLDRFKEGENKWKMTVSNASLLMSVSAVGAMFVILMGWVHVG